MMNIFRQRHLLLTALLLCTSIVCFSQHSGKSKQTWGKTEYKGKAWTTNVSQTNKITKGLQNRHISLWASHGRYYDKKKNIWKWQRPNLFCTTEDLYTQTIVIPYLIPMLQNAGAIVFTPRERDWQKNEVIVDNDTHRAPYYLERNMSGNNWQTLSGGFAQYRPIYYDNENPFTDGSARMAKTTRSKSNITTATYQPYIPEDGKYAVYVSYKTTDKSVDDAEYIVRHKGQETVFHVNQQMGGSTWVYLGTFEFDKGSSIYNSVIVSNKSKNKGVVTTDAVRFGGGMGNISRGGTTSMLPRTLEGARYYGQWAGAPYSVYSSKNGTDDYSDDINVRSFMTNWLAGGSVYVPKKEGKKVPIELSLAVHSDAGFNRDGASLVGTLAICTTNHNDGKLNEGLSRETSRKFADMLLNTITADLTKKYGKWTKRAVWDKNYSETRVPEVPAAILETLSHQSFPDMMYGQDPNFKFTLARSIYKTILHFISDMHGENYVVQPLKPDNFRIEIKSKDKLTLKWNTVNDSHEPTAKPTAYKVYTAVNNSSFDNGTVVKGTSYTIKIEQGQLYHFKVSAINNGGESFTTETLSAEICPNATKTVLVVNAFGRLSAPAIVNNTMEQGFDINSDIGVTYGTTAGWSGAQESFDISRMGYEDATGLGYSGNELAGTFIAGNDFDYVRTHSRSIHNMHKYNIVSCSREAVENGYVKMERHHAVDIVFGLEKDDGHSLKKYKTFTMSLRNKIAEYLKSNGRLFVSGAYIMSDMTDNDESEFMQQWFKTTYDGNMSYDKNPVVNGLNTSMTIYRQLNDKHYAATSVDIVSPVAPAICAMQYGNGYSASTAYSSANYRTYLMGFPFECITSDKERNWVMKAILTYLLE